MFHALSWGLPYLGWSCGADFVMPGPFLQAEPLARMIGDRAVTVLAAVPAIWNDLLRSWSRHETDLSSLKIVKAGGAAVPLSLIERFHAKTGIWITQGWGMTETSPVAALSWPPRGAGEDEQAHVGRAKTGRGLRRSRDAPCRRREGNELPWNGQSVGGDRGPRPLGHRSLL